MRQPFFIRSISYSDQNLVLAVKFYIVWFFKREILIKRPITAIATKIMRAGIAVDNIETTMSLEVKKVKQAVAIAVIIKA